MSKLNIPEDVYINNNTKKHLDIIETSKKYDRFLTRIQSFFDFVASTPTDLFGARQKGWKIEKLSGDNKKMVISIRITAKDRFTYEVNNGKVTVIGLLGHYKGTKYESVVPEDNNTLEKQASRYIEDFDESLSGTEEKNYNKKIDYIDEEKSRLLFVRQSIITNYTHVEDNLTNSLLKSKDVSTQNYGRLLRIIKVEFPHIYNELKEDIVNNLYYENNNVIYKGYPLSNSILASSEVLLRKQLSKGDTAHYGYVYLKRIITNKMDTDVEFYSLHSLLKTYTSWPGQEKLYDLLKTLKNCYENCNKLEALENIRKLVVLITYHNFKAKSTRRGSFYHPRENAIYINNTQTHDNVLLHELGHAIDFIYRRDNLDLDKEDELMAKARNHIYNSDKAEEILMKINAKFIKIRAAAGTAYDNGMIEKYGSKENALSVIENYIKQVLRHNRPDELKRLFNVTDEEAIRIINEIKKGRLNYRKLSLMYYESQKNIFASEYLYSLKEASILDIVSAIYKGFEVSFKNGYKQTLERGHTAEYFNSDRMASMNEIMANINALMVQGDNESLDLLKELIGVELYNYLMAEYNRGRLKEEKEYLDEKSKGKAA